MSEDGGLPLTYTATDPPGSRRFVSSASGANVAAGNFVADDPDFGLMAGAHWGEAVESSIAAPCGHEAAGYEVQARMKALMERPGLALLRPAQAARDGSPSPVLQLALFLRGRAGDRQGAASRALQERGCAERGSGRLIARARRRVARSARDRARTRLYDRFVLTGRERPD